MQRELLACDAREPLEVWGRGRRRTLRYQLCGNCFFSILKQQQNIKLRITNMFIKDNVFMRY